MEARIDLDPSEDFGQDRLKPLRFVGD